MIEIIHKWQADLLQEGCHCLSTYSMYLPQKNNVHSHGHYLDYTNIAMW
jgi:hypothetical protein